MHTAQQEPNIQKCVEILARNTHEAMVIAKYGSDTKEAKKWGFVENTWEDKQFQEADWNVFVKKAIKGNPWEEHDGKQAF